MLVRPKLASVDRNCVAAGSRLEHRSTWPAARRTACSTLPELSALQLGVRAGMLMFGCERRCGGVHAAALEHARIRARCSQHSREPGACSAAAPFRRATGMSKLARVGRRECLLRSSVRADRGGDTRSRAQTPSLRYPARIAGLSSSGTDRNAAFRGPGPRHAVTDAR